MSFTAKDPIQGHLSFSFDVSLVSFNHFDALKIIGLHILIYNFERCMVKCFSIWICLMFLHDCIQVVLFGRNHKTAFSSLHSIRWYMISPDGVGDVNFYHLR